MHSETHFIIELATILIVAGIGSYISKKIGLPKLIGQILGGIIIGPSFLSLVKQTEFISNLAEIGVILLMFLAGLETDLDELKKSFKKSSLIASGGIILPFIMGFFTIYILRNQFDMKEGIFLGVILTATSMGIAIETLKDLDELNSEFGMSILGAAVIDDVIGVIILAIVLSSFGQATTNIESLIIKILIFIILTALIGKWISRYILNNEKWFKSIKPRYLLGISLITVLLFSVFASNFGMAAIIGAYSFGAIMSTTALKEKVIKEIDRFGTAFFIPLFFVNIGLMINLQSVAKYLSITIVIAIVGIISKIIGSTLGARISGFDLKQSFRVGISMIPRAEVSLIISNLGLKLGFISEDIFSGVILLVVSSTILAPYLLKVTSKQKSFKVSYKKITTIKE